MSYSSFSCSASRKPRSEFTACKAYLEHELQGMSPRQWRPNLPFRGCRPCWRLSV
nr:DUF3360 family protein [Marinobacter fuscus]